MTMSELVKAYNLHDSLITNVLFRESTNELILTVEFCFWAQEGFQPGENEVGMVHLHFTDVSRFNSAGLNGNIDYFSILDVFVENDVLGLNVLDDFNDHMYCLSIVATSVDFESL